MGIAEIRDEVLKLSDEDQTDLIGSILDSFEEADPNDSN